MFKAVFFIVSINIFFIIPQTFSVSSFTVASITFSSQFVYLQSVDISQQIATSDMELTHCRLFLFQLYNILLQNQSLVMVDSISIYVRITMEILVLITRFLLAWRPNLVVFDNLDLTFFKHSFDLLSSFLSIYVNVADLICCVL